MPHSFWEKQRNRFKYALYLSRLNWILSRLANAPLILCFHRICRPQTLLDRRLDAMLPEQLEWILEYIRFLGYQFVSLEKAADQRKGRIAAVTFDDGFRDIYEQAFPILGQKQIPASIFLITSTLDSDQLLWEHKLYLVLERLDEEKQKTICADFFPVRDGLPVFKQIKEYFLLEKREKVECLIAELAQASNWDASLEPQIVHTLYLNRHQLKHMQSEGITIESHGHEHWPLPAMSEAETDRDIEFSMGVIEKEFSRKPLFYATPFGYSNPFVISVVKKNGCKGICTTEHRAIHRYENVFALPRIYRGANSPIHFAWYLGCALNHAVFRDFRLRCH